MVATSNYDPLPPQNKPDEWTSYKQLFEARADADDILEILDGTATAIPNIGNNADAILKVNHLKKLLEICKWWDMYSLRSRNVLNVQSRD